MAINDRPVVVDFVVHRDAMVWPMVPAGVSNDAIQVAKDTAPQWDREESEAIPQDEDADHSGDDATHAVRATEAASATEAEEK
jgi:acetolactate synthase-1/2/3 large subunit